MTSTEAPAADTNRQTPRLTVHELDVTRDATWQFRDSTPTWRHRRHGPAGVFDPFPAYPHSVDVVTATANLVQDLCPPRWDVELYVADREEQGRSNGYSTMTQDGHYDDDGQWIKDPPVGLIMLSGKRIPPHPALTRYLVAHEYGHHIEWMANEARGHTAQGNHTIDEYAALRGLRTPVHDGSGGRWHDSAAEVFACDFRILVAEVEPGYWPHPGIPHPLDTPLLSDLHTWWADTLTTLAAPGQEAT